MKKTINNLKFLWNYSNNSKHFFILVILLNIIKIIISILVPLYSAKLVLNLSNNELHRLLLIAFILLILNSINSILNFIILKLNIKFSSKIYLNIEKDIIERIHTLTNKTLDNTSTGTIIDRLDSDLDNISNIYFEILFRLTEFIKSIGIIIAIFIINPLVGIISILSLSIIFLIDNYQVYKVTNLIGDKNKKNEKFTETITEVIRGMRDIKMLNIEKNTINKLDVQVDDTIFSELKINKTANILGKLATLIEDLTAFFNISLYVFLISKGSLTITNALILYNYYSNISSFGGYIGQIMDNINKFNISTNRIKELFDNEKFATETFGTKHIKKVKGKFEFKDVHFNYERNEVLKGVSFIVNPDETVAFVGKTGSGKTTLLNCISTIDRVTAGKIIINNQDITKLKGNNLNKFRREELGFIFQDFNLLDTLTAYENIALALTIQKIKPNEIDARVKEIARKLGITDILKKYPYQVSGGQKQKIILARSLLKPSNILIIDEGLNEMDINLERRILKNIFNKYPNKTIIVTSHRRENMDLYNQVIKIEDGRIIENLKKKN